MRQQHNLYLIFFYLSLTCSLLACSSPHRQQKAEYFVFGTIVQLTVIDESNDKINRVISAVQQQLQNMHQKWHAWQKSQLTAIQQSCLHAETITISSEMSELIRLAQFFEQISHGYFNAASGQLIQLWGFLEDNPNRPRQPPEKAVIEKLLAQQASSLDLHLEGNTLHCRNKAVRLDFGGFVKGYGLAQISDYLRDNSIQHALLNAGGDIVTLGKNNSNQAWRIAIKDPSGGSPLATVNSSNEAVFTSAIDARGFQHQGKRYHHIINPHSGYPAIGFLSVTVIADDATLADAAATALLIAGPDNWQAVAQRMGVDKILALTTEKKLLLTNSMRQRVHDLKAL